MTFTLSRYLRGALAICCLAYGSSASAQISALMQAESAYSVGDYETAEPLYIQSVEAYGDVHEEGYTRALDRLANCYYMSGQLSRAVELFKTIVKLDEGLHGPESLRVADDLYNLTRALRRLGRFIEADGVIRRTLQLREKALGDDNRLVALSWMDLAVNYQRLGRLEDAESAFLSSIAIRDRLNDPKYASIAYFWYSQLLVKENRLPEAEKMLQHAAELNPEAYANAHLND